MSAPAVEASPITHAAVVRLPAPGTLQAAMTVSAPAVLELPATQAVMV